MTRITYAGETRSITDWARKLGLKRQTLAYRFSRGMPLEEALTPESLVARRHAAALQRKAARQQAQQKARQRERMQRERRRAAKARRKAARWAAWKAAHVRWIVYEGKEWPFSELVRAKAKVSYSVVHNRLAQGWPIERALIEPVHKAMRQK